MQKGGWVYLMTNRRDGTLYCGVTSDLARRASIEPKSGGHFWDLFDALFS
jgi:predicted GIY-YIG superfamily endonuclease